MKMFRDVFKLGEKLKEKPGDVFNSVTRLGEKSPFGRFFKGLGDFFFQKRSPKFRLHFGRFFEMVQNLDF